MKLVKRYDDIEIMGFEDIEMPVFPVYSATLIYKHKGEEYKMAFFSEIQHPYLYTEDQLKKSVMIMIDNPDISLGITSRDCL